MQEKIISPTDNKPHSLIPIVGRARVVDELVVRLLVQSGAFQGRLLTLDGAHSTSLLCHEGEN